MNLDKWAPLNVHEGTKDQVDEIINAEKKLWSLIYSKGLRHKEAPDLYVKVRSCYGKLFLDDLDGAEYKEVEYSLWKLHYKHICEFRKRIAQRSTDNGSKALATARTALSPQSAIDGHIERFELFLSEATDFYHNLISKVRKLGGLLEDPLVEEKCGYSCVADPSKLQKCQYLCHRFLVCLGDLARYGESCKMADIHRHNRSSAATYYFKAASIWPDGGNPQNQLALLATNMGDDFLALYHCIRSLAVKEPFPGAQDNLIFLFEKNRSSHLESLSQEAHFNFSNPSERCKLPTESSSDHTTENSVKQVIDPILFAESDLWPLFVRFISLFFIESSSEEFHYTFASTMRDLDFLLALDDTKLNAALESYQHMDPGRTCPCRGLQLVSILIFITDSVVMGLAHKGSKDRNISMRPIMVNLALEVVFIFLGRLIERCLKGSSVKLNPLLPSVLVFMEWFAGILARVEKYVFHEEVIGAVSYFIDAVVELVNQLEFGGECDCEVDAALWEDRELRGFAPIAPSLEPLDFRTDVNNIGEFNGGNDARVHRLRNAAMKIVANSIVFQKCISCDTGGKKLFIVEHMKRGPPKPSSVDLDFKENAKSIRSLVMEEEEEIIFKPTGRFNLSPSNPSSTDEAISTEVAKGKTATFDDSSIHATSSFADSQSAQNDHYQTSNKLESLQYDNVTPHPAGPPSLSAWVFDQESSSTDKEMATRDFFKLRLSPVDQMASLSLTNSSYVQSENSSVNSDPPPPPPHSVPVPSAPLLPDDAVLFRGRFDFCDTKKIGTLGASSMGGACTNKHVLGAPLGFCPMSSSQWLHMFRNQNLNRKNFLIQPCHNHAPVNIYAHDMSKFGQCDRWGYNSWTPSPVMYQEIPQVCTGYLLGHVAHEFQRDNLFHNYQRPLSPYGCSGDVAAVRAPPLLYHLKEREWHLQNQSQARSPTPAYVGT